MLVHHLVSSFFAEVVTNGKGGGGKLICDSCDSCDC